ncbi:hypothetical protein HQ520_10940, partial [bacterium]|nr:hypothetical protein [bacterium]
MNRRIFRFLCLIPAMVMGHSGAQGQTEAIPKTDRLTIVNYSDKPVYAMAVTIPSAALYQALDLPAGTPLQATTAEGETLALLRGTENGEGVVRVYLSLKPEERAELKLGKAATWGAPENICSARFDAPSGSGSIGNGVVALEYGDGKWNLAFEGDEPARKLITDCWLDCWLDPAQRGRLMGIDPKPLGLIQTSEARLVRGEA